jgi:glutamine synthetase
MGQRHDRPEDAEVSVAGELVALVCCDLGAIVRGRSVFASMLDELLHTGVSWVPANQALTPFGPVAEPNPFGSVGDLRLVPDPDTRVRVAAAAHAPALDFVLCDIVETDGRPWECDPRRFLRDTLAELEQELDVHVVTSFEHEFQLLLDSPPALPFSLRAQRQAEPFATHLMAALQEAGVEPERFFPEYAAHQFEIPVAPAEALASADRSVVFREVVRDVARQEGMRVSFAPLLDPAGAGNGVHIHFNVLDGAGSSMLYDGQRAASLSEFGEQFAAGIIRHARALSAVTAPSPVSAARLQPHRWSAGAVCLAERNREALLRIPPLVALAGGGLAEQMRLEYRGADASANPYLALAVIVRAGLDGVRAELPAPPILDRDPTRLEHGEAERYGVGALPASLAESLQALAEDDVARAWMDPLLYDAYMAVKRAELEAAAGLDLDEICRRYAAIY